MLEQDQAPKKPTEFIYANGMRRLVPVPYAHDTLGGELLGDQASMIEDDVRYSDAGLEKVYWDDMSAFYGVSDEDVKELPLADIANKYKLTGANHEHAMALGSLTLDYMRESASERSTFTTDYAKVRLEKDISILRKDLGSMLSDPIARMHLNRYLNKPKTKLPPLFNDMRLKSDGKRMRWSEWLTDGATTDQFMNFLQWHNQHMHDVNEDQQTVEAISRQKLEYTDMLHKFADEGFFNSNHINHKLGYSGKPDTRVYIGDIFATTARDMGGYFFHRPNYNWQYVIVGEDHIEEATKHELNHAFLGQFSDRWLNEATTEHIAVAMKKGEMGLVAELADEGVYKSERGLLHAVMSEGSEPIALQDLFQGYTETKYEWSKNTFEEAVDKSWGKGALLKIGNAVKEIEDLLVADGQPIFQARASAALYVRSSLASDPDLIFGDGYKKPQIDA